MVAVLDQTDDERRAAYAGEVAARIERLPVTAWQIRARIIIGTATFFDAFDALAIAYILPVIVPLWKISPQEVGLLISAGFFGQLFGALAADVRADPAGHFAREPSGDPCAIAIAVAVVERGQGQQQPPHGRRAQRFRQELDGALEL